MSWARPLDARSPTSSPSAEIKSTQVKRKTPLSLLDAVPLFTSLNEDEKEVLADSMKRRTFKKDEVIIEQGDTSSSLKIVRSGVIIALRRDGIEEEVIDRLAPGDCFGETGFLLGVFEAATLRALTAVVVYEIDQEGLAPLLRDPAAKADELATALSRRVQFGQVVAEPVHDKAIPTIVTRIRHLFARQSS